MKAEIIEQTTKISHHPSVILFSGNNENKQALQENWYQTSSNKTVFVSEYMKLYDGIIRKSIHEIIDVPFLLSSPSNGESEGWVHDDPQSELAGDIHFYDYFNNCLNTSYFPIPRFASEFGFQSYPSIKTLRSAFKTHHVELFDKNTEHRQHLVDGNEMLNDQVTRMFGSKTKTNKSLAGQTLVYLTQLNQALCVSSEIAHYRRHYNRLLSDGRGMTAGVLLWQLNDVWAAPTWSIIDINMRTKMSFFAVRNLYKEVIGTGFWNGTCMELFVVNELNKQVEFSFDLFLYDSENKLHIKEWVIEWKSVNPRSSSLVFTLSDTQLSEFCPDLSKCFVAVEFSVKSQNIRTTDIVRLSHDWKGLVLKNPGLSVEVFEKQVDRFVLKIKSLEIALWVWLEAAEDGYFSENAFPMYQPVIIVEFVPRHMTDTCCKVHATSLYNHY